MYVIMVVVTVFFAYCASTCPEDLIEMYWIMKRGIRKFAWRSYNRSNHNRFEVH